MSLHGFLVGMGAAFATMMLRRPSLVITIGERVTFGVLMLLTAIVAVSTS